MLILEPKFFIASCVVYVNTHILLRIHSEYYTYNIQYAS